MTGTKKRTNTPSEDRPVRRRVPPPPGFGLLPEPPSFGWIGDPDDLTHGELNEIVRHSGQSLRAMDMQMLLPYAAVAYARRENPEKYHWGIVSHLKIKDIETGVLDEGPTEEELADAQAKSIETGEPMPDPA